MISKPLESMSKHDLTRRKAIVYSTYPTQQRWLEVDRINKALVVRDTIDKGTTQ